MLLTKFVTISEILKIRQWRVSKVIGDEMETIDKAKEITRSGVGRLKGSMTLRVL